MDHRLSSGLALMFVFLFTVITGRKKVYESGRKRRLTLGYTLAIPGLPLSSYPLGIQASYTFEPGNTFGMPVAGPYFNAVSLILLLPVGLVLLGTGLILIRNGLITGIAHLLVASCILLVMAVTFHGPESRGEFDVYVPSQTAWVTWCSMIYSFFSGIVLSIRYYDLFSEKS